MDKCVIVMVDCDKKESICSNFKETSRSYLIDDFPILDVCEDRSAVFSEKKLNL